jgi:hypothetical protein
MTELNDKIPVFYENLLVGHIEVQSDGPGYYGKP